MKVTEDTSSRSTVSCEIIQDPPIELVTEIFKAGGMGASRSGERVEVPGVKLVLESWSFVSPHGDKSEKPEVFIKGFKLVHCKKGQKKALQEGPCRDIFEDPKIK